LMRQGGFQVERNHCRLWITGGFDFVVNLSQIGLGLAQGYRRLSRSAAAREGRQVAADISVVGGGEVLSAAVMRCRRYKQGSFCET